MSQSHTDQQLRHFQVLLRWGGGVSAVFFLISVISMVATPTWVMVASTLLDGALTLWLIALLSLHRRMALANCAFMLGISILLYCVLSVLLFPDSLLRLLCICLLAVIVALPYISSRQLWYLSITSWLTTTAIYLISQRNALNGEAWIDATSIMAAVALILVALHQFHERINTSLVETRTANRALQDTQASLEEQVTERTQALQQALGDLSERATHMAHLLAEGEDQRTMIRLLSIPILPVAPMVLAMPLVGAFDLARLGDVQERALAMIEQHRAAHLVVDLTAVPLIDDTVAAGLMRLSQMATLIGARIILTGIRPEVAQALVALETNLSELHVASSLQEGIAQALRRQGAGA
jgi:anti-anti-sigma regulatory factor